MIGVNAAHIPAELRALKCWHAHVNKAPADVNGLPLKAWQEPANCLTFDAAVERATALEAGSASEGQLIGVGIALAASGDVRALDFDGPRDPTTGATAAGVMPLIAGIDSYTELSPSETGFRVLFRAGIEQPGKWKRQDVGWTHATPGKTAAVEMFAGQGFVTITGKRLDGTPTTINERPSTLEHPHFRRQATATPKPVGIARSGGGRDVKEALRALDALRATRFDDRDEWLAVGMMLHSVSPELLPVWQQRTAAKHTCHGDPCGRTDETCAAAWHGFKDRDNAITLASGIMWAHEDQRPARHPADSLPLDVTALELANNPALLQVPASLSPWLVWRGEYNILVGREKLAGKSTLAGSDAVAALKAGLVVLWLTAEESQNRVVKRFADLQAPLGKLILLRRWPQSWDEVEAVIRRRKPDAIYVDSQSSFLFAVDGEVPQTSELEKWQAKGLRFKSWSQLVPAHLAGVCVLVHAKKGDGTYAGSVGIGAAADTIITMRDVDKHPTARRLEMKGRWGFPSEVVRYVDDVQGYVSAADLDGAQLALEQTKAVPKGQLKKIFDALKPGMTYSEWEQAYGGAHETFKSGVRRLKERDLVTQHPQNGTWAPVQFMAEQELAA